MKKLLALVLALVMVMGLSVVSANAASTTFSDEASIEHVEAAAVLNAIGVLSGADGKFNPSQTLTREQGAKILTYMLMGQKAADALTVSSAPFDDVAANRWSAGSIAYCKALGILGGVGDNKFNPEGELTGAAFGKMLLVALGYQSNYEGFGGADWTLNVARLVNSTGLADKIGSMPYNSAISRDNAAQMAYNTLIATMQEYSGALTVDKDGNFGNVRGNQGNTSYDYRVGTGVPGAGGTMQFCENYFPNLKYDNVTATDNFGNPMAYWYLGNDRLDFNRTSAKTITGVTTGDKVLTYTDAVAVKTIYADLGLGTATAYGDGTTLGNIFIDGRAYLATGAAITAPSAAGLAGTNYTSAALAGTTITNGDTAKIGGKGILTTVTYTANVAQPIRISLKTTFLVQAQADYNTNSKTLSIAMPVGAAGGGVAGTIGLTTAKTTISGDPTVSEHFDIVTTAKEDDLFWATATVSATGVWTIRTLEPLTSAVQNVAVTGYKNTSSVTAGGTTYSYAAAAKRATNDNATWTALFNTGYTMGSGTTYDLFLDPYGYVLGAKEHTTTSKMSDYVLVLSGEVTAMDARAKLLFSDGTTKTVDISKVIDKITGGGTTTYVPGAPTGTNVQMSTDAAGLPNFNYTTGAVGTNHMLAMNRFYTYHVDKNGAYELTLVATTVGTAAGQQNQVNETITGNNANPLGTTAGEIANNNSILLAGTKVYTGIKNWPNLTPAANVTTLYDPSNANYILGAYTAGATSSTATANDYFYVFSGASAAVDADGDTYYVYDAVKNGELVQLSATNATGTAKANGLYVVTTYEDDLADLTGAPAVATPATTAFKWEQATAQAGGTYRIKDGTITDGATTGILADDVKIYLFDARAGESHTVEEVSASVINTLEATKTYTTYGLASSTTASAPITVVYVARMS